MTDTNFNDVFKKFEDEHSPEDIFYFKKIALAATYSKKIDWNSFADEEKNIFEQNLKGYFEGYQFYIHDMNLSKDISSNYHVGTTLYNPGELYFTAKSVGLNKNYRFLVVSNMMDNLSFNLDGSIAVDESRVGLCITDISECFKVIDVYKTVDGKTQITLLNYPPMLELILKSHQTDFEKELIPKARKYFDDSLKKDVLEDLDDDNWSDYFKEYIGLCVFDQKVTFYTKKSILIFLQIMSNLEEELTLDVVIKFINSYDISYYVYILSNALYDLEELVNGVEGEEYKLEIFNDFIDEKTKVTSAGIRKELLSQELSPEDEERYNKNWLFFGSFKNNYL